MIANNFSDDLSQIYLLILSMAYVAFFFFRWGVGGGGVGVGGGGEGACVYVGEGHLCVCGGGGGGGGARSPYQDFRKEKFCPGFENQFQTISRINIIINIIRL